MWILVWALLTPGGDVLSHGAETYNERVTCNVARVKIESQPLLLGQKIQAICLERSK